jgi:hypothetical protein
MPQPQRHSGNENNFAYGATARKVESSHRLSSGSVLGMSTVAREDDDAGVAIMRDPVWVYDNWSAYTDGFYQEYLQLPDETRLTEELAMRQLRELARLKRCGVHFDYYMMNAFWFDPDGAYRDWRKPDWPDGPDRWIAGCQDQGLKPGLWFGTNSLWKINVAPQWRDSLAPKRDAALEVLSLDSMSFYEGGFLPDFMDVLQYWYDRGIRMFEFDVANFDAATAAAIKNQSSAEIRSRNQLAFSNALKQFRRSNPDVMLAAFNDFGGDIHSTVTPFPFKKPVDLRWLEVFDTLYTGDTRVSDVPLINFWRSVDLYNDHMTRRYEQSGVPLERSDPFFTLSSTWFGYKREKIAWKGMLLLSLARGSWKKTIYGDLQLLSDEDARWFAKVQDMYAPLLAMGRTKAFGGIPGDVQPYGFGSFGTQGAIYTIVNPTQEMRQIHLPYLSRVQSRHQPARIIFHDDGYVPTLKGMTVSVGPEQMCVIGFGVYADEKHHLGVERDVVIPHDIKRINALFVVTAQNAVETTIAAPRKEDLRLVFWQRNSDESAPRSAFLRIEAEQNGRQLIVLQPDQQRAVSTGISWAAGEIRHKELVGDLPITVRCSSTEKQPVTLHGNVYAVAYAG